MRCTIVNKILICLLLVCDVDIEWYLGFNCKWQQTRIQQMQNNVTTKQNGLQK